MEDRLILQNELAVSLGKMVSRWLDKHGIEDEMSADIMVSRPSCYLDDAGNAHTGPLVTVQVELACDEE